MRVAIIVVSVWCMVGLAMARPDGASAGSCGNMIPGHGTENTGESPYMISLSKTTYGCGESITVTLAGGMDSTMFQGFLCQARHDPMMEATTGMIDSSQQNNKCEGNKASITHKDIMNKQSVQFTWKQYGTPMNFYVVCTVAPAKDNYYLKQMSAMVTFTGNAEECMDNGTNGLTFSGAITIAFALVAVVARL